MAAITFSVVTPCLNAAALLPETLRSLHGQTALASGDAELEHIVVDGGSTDGTLELLRALNAAVVSEPDRGMYDALAKGLRRARGEWITYLNAGDTLDPAAFATVLQAARLRDVRWLTGRSGMVDEKGRLLQSAVPYRYRRSLLLAGQYCRRAPLYLPFLQQEGTFWRRELLATIDSAALASFAVAGDQYLWARFATECEPAIVTSPLGVFHRHRGQLSEDRARYHAEVRSMAQPLTAADAIRGVIDRVLWHAPVGIKKMLNRRQLI